MHMMTMKNDSDKEKKDIVEPDEYDIHYHRYTLQFKFIPELIDRVNEDNWDVRKPLRSFLFIRSLL